MPMPVRTTTAFRPSSPGASINGLLVNASYTYSRTFYDSTADFNSTARNPRRPQDSQNIKGGILAFGSGSSTPSNVRWNL